MRCSVCQGLLWVTSPISDFLLCVIRLSQTLSTATDKSEGVGPRRGGARGRPNFKKSWETALTPRSFYTVWIQTAAVLGFHLEVADVFCVMESKVSTGLHKLIILNHKLASRAFALHYGACGTSNPETLMYSHLFSNVFSVTINMRWLPGRDPLRMTPM